MVIPRAYSHIPILGLAVLLTLSRLPDAKGQDSANDVQRKVQRWTDQLQLASNEEAQLAAVRGLGDLGPGGKNAIPDLIYWMMNAKHPTWEEGQKALVKIGPPADLECAKSLMSKDDSLDYHRLIVTIEDLYRPKNEKLDDALIAALKKGSPSAQVMTAWLIQKKSRIKTAIPLLIEMLDDPKSRFENRIAAARALGVFAEDASHATPSLHRAFRDRKNEESVRLSSIRSLGAVNKKSPEVAKLLRSVIRDESELPQVRIGAMSGLAVSDFAQSSIDDFAAIVKSTFVEDLQEGEALFLRSAAASILKRLIPTETTLPILTDALNRRIKESRMGDMAVRADLLKCISNGGKSAKSALPAIVASLSDREISDESMSDYVNAFLAITDRDESIAALIALRKSSQDELVRQHVDVVIQGLRRK